MSVSQTPSNKTIDTSNSIPKSVLPPLNLKKVDSKTDSQEESSSESSPKPKMKSGTKREWRRSMDFGYLSPRSDEKKIVKNMDIAEQFKVARLQRQAMIELGFIRDNDKFTPPVLRTAEKIEKQEVAARNSPKRLKKSSDTRKRDNAQRQTDTVIAKQWMEVAGLKSSSTKNSVTSSERAREKAHRAPEKFKYEDRSADAQHLKLRPEVEKTAASGSDHRKERITSPDGGDSE